MIWSGIGVTTLLVTIVITVALWTTVLITVRALLHRGRSPRKGTELRPSRRRITGRPQ